ncbi:gluconate kinase, SKI family [Psychromonas ingrahamii 37]|uniref:Gluconokinase n=1 Tax=Psychromonas ingrahamii (strain DSM 17664 / CCUG 51855 / 37) TaxID=357804 RepID=A1SYR9_PSYIN|nr:gluconokinase [Psychromonas ingrahamii]ABM04634.1 gluconate kinase, SKI family [Psychromonas ingrahamii 37]
MDKQLKGRVFIVMGVAGSGKSSLGEALGKALNIKFIDGDDLHPKANILKMAAGQHLNDNDRIPWLERIRDAVFSIEKNNENAIIVCSALKRQYRDLICEGNHQVTFLLLYGEFELVLKRMLARKNHFMPTALLKSQFDALELPQEDEKNIIKIDIDGSFEEVVERCIIAIKTIQ